MTIIIDENTRISTDRYNFMVERRSIVQKGKTAGKEVWSIEGYYANIGQTVEALHQLNIRQIDADGAAVIAEIRRSEQAIVAAIEKLAGARQ